MSLARPPLGPPKPFSFPATEHSVAANGMDVVSCHLPGRALASVVLVIDAGAEREPPEKGGVAALTASALREGTTARDAAAFNDALEMIGARLFSWSDWEEIGVFASAPAGRVADVLALVAEAVGSPSLTDDAIGRLRVERLNRLAQMQAHAGMRAHLAFAPSVFDGAGLYGRDPDGERSTVDGLTPDDVRAYHVGTIGPQGATLIVAGDLTGLDVAAAADAAFAGWSAARSLPQRSPVHPRTGGAAVTLVDRPGSVQSELIVGHASISRSSPDHTALDLAMTVLAGKFDSRVMMLLREEKGYTYGARGGIDARRLGGTLSLGAAVDAPHTAESVSLLVQELHRLRDAGITQDELTTTRDYLNGVFPLRNETARQIATLLADLAIHELPDDHWDHVQRERASLTVEAVNEIAARTTGLPDLSVVIVGDEASVGADVRALGLGPVEVVRD